MSVPVRNFLKYRRDRALGSILGYAEREIWPSLTGHQREAMRRVVVDALTGYHDAVLDLVKAGDDVHNEFSLQVLRDLERIRRLTAKSASDTRSKDGATPVPTAPPSGR